MAEENKIKRVVVGQLPQVEARSGKDEEGNEVEFVTIEEALTELLNK